MARFASARACSSMRRFASFQEIGSSSTGTSQNVNVDPLIVDRRPVITLLWGSVRAYLYSASLSSQAERVKKTP